MSNEPATTLELLRDLVRAKKSGTLSLRGEKGTSEIRLAHGNVEDAVHGRAAGEKALYRALSIPVGRASFAEGAPTGPARIATATDALLDGAVAVLSVIANLRDSFPDMATRPIVAADTGGSHVEISEQARALLHHLRTPLLIDDLLDAVPGTDAHTLRAVGELEEAGRIRHLASTLSRTPLASHEQLERLRTMATLGLRRGFGKRVRLVFAGTPGRLAILAHATQCITGAKSCGASPLIPMPHPIVRIDLGPELELELVSLPLVPAYAPLWQMALTGSAIVVRLEEAGGSLLEEACEAAGAKIVDAHMLVGPYDEGNVAEVAVLVRAALEA
ncbi:MAG: DUF4388 domain-containing protein [Polyangiaceae bacterium]